MSESAQTERTQQLATIWPSLRRESLSTRAARILKRYILLEQLQAGYRLPSERRLADWLNVSRMVLREAIQQLIGEGILHRPSPHALCVTDFDRTRYAAEASILGDGDAELRELVEVRVFIEIGAIEAIVERATDEHLQEIERWVVEGERRFALGEPILRVDARFHAALLRAVGNRTIDAFVPLIEEHLRQSHLLPPHDDSAFIAPENRRVVDQHRQIFEAIKRRDLDEARRLMVGHLALYLHGTGDGRG